MRGSIGVSTASFYPHYLTEDALVTVAELGFPVVEIFLQADGEYGADFGRTLAQRRRAMGVRVHGLHLYAPLFRLWSPYRRMVQETRDRFRRALEVATEVEAHVVTWHGLYCQLESEVETVERFFESLHWAVAEARVAGVTLCLENVSWCYLRGPEHAAQLRARELDLGFTFDTFQAAESGVDAEALLLAMGDRIANVHLSDYAPEGPRHLPPGQGTLAWDAQLGAILGTGYRGPLIIEVAHLEDLDVLVQARDFVQRQLARITASDQPAAGAAAGSDT